MISLNNKPSPATFLLIVVNSLMLLAMVFVVAFTVSTRRTLDELTELLHQNASTDSYADTAPSDKPTDEPANESYSEFSFESVLLTNITIWYRDGLVPVYLLFSLENNTPYIIQHVSLHSARLSYFDGLEWRSVPLRPEIEDERIMPRPVPSVAIMPFSKEYGLLYLGQFEYLPQGRLCSISVSVWEMARGEPPSRVYHEFYRENEQPGRGDTAHDEIDICLENVFFADAEILRHTFSSIYSPELNVISIVLVNDTPNFIEYRRPELHYFDAVSGLWHRLAQPPVSFSTIPGRGGFEWNRDLGWPMPQPALRTYLSPFSYVRLSIDLNRFSMLGFVPPEQDGKRQLKISVAVEAHRFVNGRGTPIAKRGIEYFIHID